MRRLHEPAVPMIFTVEAAARRTPGKRLTVASGAATGAGRSCVRSLKTLGNPVVSRRSPKAEKTRSGDPGMTSSTAASTLESRASEANGTLLSARSRTLPEQPDDTEHRHQADEPARHGIEASGGLPQQSSAQHRGQPGGQGLDEGREHEDPAESQQRAATAR